MTSKNTKKNKTIKKSFIKSKINKKFKIKTKFKKFKTKRKFKKSKKNNNEGKKSLDLPTNFDIFMHNPNFKKQMRCNYNEYFNLAKPEFSYKKYYKSYESGEQFKALVNIAFKYNPVILSRLLELALKRFNPKLTNIIYKIIISKKKDDEIYNQLRKLYHTPINKFYIKKSTDCDGSLPIQEYISRYITLAQRDRGAIDINKYLDIGCGNGKFCISMGKLLDLKKDEIYGVDLDDFSEQGNWRRSKYTDKFTFKRIQFDESYPFEDDTFDLISIKMVLHHVKNYEFTLSEMARVLKKDGLIIIIDHESFTYADYMLNDIEHGFYLNVFNKNTTEENFLDLKSKSIYKEKKSIGVHKYYSWVELDYNFRRHGFEYIRKQLFSNNINFSMGASRAYVYMFKLHNKEKIPASHTF